jgi:2-C-methyl-D-erythritol 4-phosphate cytidylyltransferase / 2-C-methyl-D-erythritol 2,4-cyclodiphosphate synthase
VLKYWSSAFLTLVLCVIEGKALGIMVQGRKVAAVIVAGGSGARAGGDLPKQYQLLGGEAIIRRTLQAFLDHPEISHVISVIGDGHADWFRAATAGLPLPAPVTGGSTRQDSCREGIEAAAEFAPDVILIHDAARPFVSPALISRVIAAVDEESGAIPGLPVTDTLKRTEQGIVGATVKRDQLWSVQTPQGFPFTAIRAAHKAARDQGIDTLTDDAAVAEAHGLDVRVVIGEVANIKLTTNEDIRIAQHARARESYALRPDVRTGQGIDFHVFQKGNFVTLGGTKIPHSHGLKGHSDADVVLHAVTDAILGSIGESDIGAHFPPSDAKWKNADSRIFVAKAMELLRARDGVISQIDVTVLAEAPKVNPHVAAMKDVLAALCGVTLDRIAIKATTTEKMGAIGRKEGIAAFALATVRLP